MTTPTDSQNEFHSDTVSQLLTLLNNTTNANIPSEVQRAQLVSAARTFLARVQSPWENIRRYLVDSPAVHLSIKVCIDLDLFQKWRDAGNENKTTAELAQLTGCDEDLLHRFLRHLATEHLLAEVAPGTYAQTRFTLAMCEPHFEAWPRYMDEVGLDALKAIPDLLTERGYKKDALSMTDGAFQAAHDCVGMSVFDYFASHPDRAQNFNNAMTGINDADRSSWLDMIPSSYLLDAAEEGPLIVDVAGGIGHDIEKFCRRYPALAPRLYLEDLPAIVKDAICGSDIQIISHDFFDPQPVTGARVYYLHRILHDWPDVKALQILENLKPALRKGYSKLLLHELVVLDKVSDSSPQVTSFDLAMMGLFSSQERTESMWRDLLDKAGFLMVKVWTNEAAVESIIEAEVA